MHLESTTVWADSVHAGQLATWAKAFLHLTTKTVSRPRGASGFVRDDLDDLDDEVQRD
ncbi:hypothetical protein [Streptomyces sp. NPDC006739]|uniref:hypothetical protein n=1 Tax=Streptomyces sp. NPDC006739 TaxID=3364763 RepID=UPI0036C966D9